MFQTDRNGAKLLQASHAGRGQKISHDDDAKHDLHTLLLLLSQGMGVRISES
jgi:hypothetical protein